jgi:hypothetical protein
MEPKIIEWGKRNLLAIFLSLLALAFIVLLFSIGDNKEDKLNDAIKLQGKMIKDTKDKIDVKYAGQNIAPEITGALQTQAINDLKDGDDYKILETQINQYERDIARFSPFTLLGFGILCCILAGLIANALLYIMTKIDFVDAKAWEVIIAVWLGCAWIFGKLFEAMTLK